MYKARCSRWGADGYGVWDIEVVLRGWHISRAHHKGSTTRVLNTVANCSGGEKNKRK